jgi:pimeloyl-ACP methyl ester carboxylesterase
VARRLQRRLSVALSLRLPNLGLLPTPPAMERMVFSCAGGEPRGLAVLLPGIVDEPRDFVRHGFIDAARAHGLPLDVLAVDAHFGYYARRTVVQRLREEIIGPARESGYDEVWILGISLGGLGALLYAREYPEDVAGLILFAPFLGHPPVIDEIRQAGGIASWQPGLVEASDFERVLWSWLAGYGNGDARPPIHLAFGEQDRFAPANRLLGELLPRSHVLITPGGHDWGTWRRQWRTLLERHWRIDLRGPYQPAEETPG